MKVVVSAGFLSGISSIGYLEFLSKTVASLIVNQPDHQFVILCEKQYAGLFPVASNVRIHLLKRPATHPLLIKFWYNHRLPVLLKKYKADRCIVAGGFCSMNTSVAQCLLIDGAAFVQSLKKSRRFFQKNGQRFLDKAAVIITFSAAARSELISDFNIEPSKIQVIYNGISSAFHPVGDEIKNSIKEQYTGGKEFFLYNGSIRSSQNGVTLLKAFSLFKKRQQSNMQLFFCGHADAFNVSFVKNLQTYKYRADVILATNLDETTAASVTASAYATIYPITDDGFAAPLMKSLRCHTPIITADTPLNREIAGNAALYADAADQQAIADQLMRMYKDETGRSQLIKAAIDLDTTYSWDHAADLLWSVVSRPSQ